MNIGYDYDIFNNMMIESNTFRGNYYIFNIYYNKYSILQIIHTSNVTVNL